MTNPHFQLYIDGSFCEGAGGAVMHSQNPADGKTWASFACTDKQDVERAVVAAKRALDNPEWRDMMQTARGKLLFKLADLIEQHAGRLGELETQDSGKLLAETAT